MEHVLYYVFFLKLFWLFRLVVVVWCLERVFHWTNGCREIWNETTKVVDQSTTLRIAVIRLSLGLSPRPEMIDVSKECNAWLLILALIAIRLQTSLVVPHTIMSSITTLHLSLPNPEISSTRRSLVNWLFKGILLRWLTAPGLS